MDTKGFFASLFDYSFSSFVTPRLITILYVLTTIVVGLWTLAFVLAAFNSSTGFGLITLIVLGPLFFVIGMIYARVLLEVLIVFFRINDNVHNISARGTSPAAEMPTPVPPPTEPGPSAATA